MEFRLRSQRRTTKSISSPLVWLLVKQIDRLENNMEKLKMVHSKDIKNLQSEVHRFKKTETFVGFHAKLLAHKQLVSNERIIFNHVLYNTGNAYDPYTGTFKAPFDGEYFFTSSFVSISGRTLHLQMFKNDVEISKGYSAPGSSTGGMSAVVNLKAGDGVYVLHMKRSTDEKIHGEWSYFTGFLLRRTE